MRPAAAALLALACVAGLPAFAGDNVQDIRLDAARDLASRFQKELGGRLMTAMSAGGPVQAIEVCKTDAPAIAARLSAESGARVSRTALRLRNSGNAPDAEARGVLEDFDRRLKAGASAPPEAFEPTRGGGARYMKAIITQPMCTACHGKEIAPEVRAALAQHYPNDQATGFAIGELRGAFLIDWPPTTETRP